MIYRRQAALVAVLLCAFAQQVGAQIPVSSAAELCAATADPCVVTGPTVVAAGTTLDFGTRALLVSPGGSLEFGEGASEVRCGEFRLETPGAVALKVRGAQGTAGRITVTARRNCTLADNLPCLSDFDCQVLAAGTLEIHEVVQDTDARPD